MHHRRAVELERAQAMATEADRRGGWTILTARSDGVVESSSRPSSSSIGRDGRIPSDVSELLPSSNLVRNEPSSHDVTIGDERWRCVVHPMPVGPTVLLVRRLDGETASAASLHDLGLTARQTDVAIELARSGGTNAHLARSLDISEGTVKKHLEPVFRVLGVDNRAAAVVALRSMIG